MLSIVSNMIIGLLITACNPTSDNLEDVCVIVKQDTLGNTHRMDTCSNLYSARNNLNQLYSRGLILDGVFVGYDFQYYPSGNLALKSGKIGDQKSGRQLEYFDLKQPVVNSEKIFTIYKDTSYFMLNTIKNVGGDIVEVKGDYYVLPNKTKVKYGDSLEVKIGFKSPKNKNIELVIGGLDEWFQEDTLSQRESFILKDKSEIIFKKLVNKRGRNVIIGKVLDFYFESENKHGGIRTGLSYPVFIEYYVE